MRIVIDARMLSWTGVGRYTQALLEYLQQLDHENNYLVLVRRQDWELWSPQAPNFSKIETSIDPYTLGEQLWLPWVLRNLKPDLVHFTAPNTPLLWRGRRVVTIHDLTLVDFDTGRHIGWRRNLWRVKRLVFRLVLWNDARFATRLITDTEYVKEQLHKRYGVAAGRVRVGGAAADPQLAEPKPIDRLRLAKNYALYVGNAFPYKNVASTIRALAELDRQHDNLELVVAGKRDTFTKGLEQLAAQLGVSKRVRFVGFVSDGELVTLYRRAAVYVYPSLSEGFGLQGLEAMTQDLPVAAARATCLPEVYGEAAAYFDPHDPTDQAKVVAQILDDKALAEKLRAAGRARIKQFSWRRMAEQTLEVYRGVAKER